ncbi:unnamed protein product [Closterium sp. NIES-54]
MAAAKRVLRYLCSTSGLGLVLGGRSPVVLTGHADASWVDDLATQRSSQGYTFSLGSGSVSWRSTRSSSVLSSNCEAKIYAGAMAAQELRWLTYLLTDLGEPPRSPPVLYVDNKAMLALYREHRLEHRTKHIALRYFLARELQQRGQLRLAYVASQANTADIFTKALQPCPSAPPLVPLATAPATAATPTAAATPAAIAATAAPECCATMASLRVLVFDHEGRPVAFDTWHDDLQLYLLSDIKYSVSLFDLVSNVAPAPPATADGATRSQWLSREATSRLAIRNHLPVAECTHIGQHRTAQSLYDAVVARYSSPATAALGRLLLPYLFPELSAFATVADVVTHLRTSDARYRATVPAEFLATNQPPMFITLYFIVSRLPDSLRSVRDHFLSLDPTSLTVDLLEQHLLANETSAVTVGAARGTPRSPFFEGCSPSPLPPFFASFASADVFITKDFGAASTSAKRRSSKGKGGRGGGGGSGGGGGGSGSSDGGSGGGSGDSGGGGGGGTRSGSGGFGGGGGGGGGSCGSGGGGTGGGRSRPRRGGPGGGHAQQQQRRSENKSSQQLREWLVQRGTGGGCESCPTDLLRSGVAIFDLDYDAIISAMYALSFSAEGDCYRCVPPDPGIAAAALGASAFGTPPAPLSLLSLHMSWLDWLTPLGAQSIVTTTTPGGQRVSICTCTWVGRHLATFTRRPGSSLFTLATEPPQVAASAQVSASGQVAASCSCRLLSHQTLLCYHRLGNPSLPCLRGMHSRLLRAAPHSSSFPLTTAPLQTLHMDVWGPARVSGQGRERYFRPVVDDYTRYTTAFPLRSKGELVDVLIPWIRTVLLQLHERFGTDLPVLRLHSDRGGEFSSDLLREFCRGEGIL